MEIKDAVVKSGVDVHPLQRVTLRKSCMDAEVDLAAGTHVFVDVLHPGDMITVDDSTFIVGYWCGCDRLGYHIYELDGPTAVALPVGVNTVWMVHADFMRENFPGSEIH